VFRVRCPSNALTRDFRLDTDVTLRALSGRRASLLLFDPLLSVFIRGKFDFPVRSPRLRVSVVNWVSDHPMTRNHPISRTHPVIFSFRLQTKHFHKSTLGPPLHDACVTLAWPLGDAWVTQSQPQVGRGSQPQKHKNATGLSVASKTLMGQTLDGSNT
jgi:hypothetical protein